MPKAAFLLVMVLFSRLRLSAALCITRRARLRPYQQSRARERRRSFLQPPKRLMASASIRDASTAEDTDLRSILRHQGVDTSRRTPFSADSPLRPRPRLRAQIGEAPRAPGVYTMRDKDGSPLYIGKSILLHERVRSYFRFPPPREADDASKVVLPANLLSRRIAVMTTLVEGIDYIVTETGAAALLLEASLTQAQQPPFNVLLKDDRRHYPFVCITWSEPFPRVVVTRRGPPPPAAIAAAIAAGDNGIRSLGAKSKKGGGGNTSNTTALVGGLLSPAVVAGETAAGTATKSRLRRDAYYGPFVDPAQLKTTLELVRRTFPLRQRPKPLYKDKPCLNYDIGLCPGPCQGLVTAEAYAETARRAEQVFAGDGDTLVARLHADMRAAAAREEFETAGLLKKRAADVARGLSGSGLHFDGGDPRISRDVAAVAAVAVAEENGAEQDSVTSPAAAAMTTAAAAGGATTTTACFQLFKVRRGRVSARLAFRFSGVPAELSDGELLQLCLERYYTIFGGGGGNGAAQGIGDLPDEVLTACVLPEGGAELLSDLLTSLAAGLHTDAGIAGAAGIVTIQPAPETTVAKPRRKRRVAPTAAPATAARLEPTAAAMEEADGVARELEPPLQKPMALSPSPRQPVRVLAAAAGGEQHHLAELVRQNAQLEAEALRGEVVAPGYAAAAAADAVAEAAAAASKKPAGASAAAGEEEAALALAWGSDEPVTDAEREAAAEGAAAATAARTAEGLSQLAAMLGLPSPPRRIEAFDISHTMGEETVASRVVLLDGMPAPHLYRRYKIRSKAVAAGRPDDYASVREVVARRFRQRPPQDRADKTAQSVVTAAGASMGETMVASAADVPGSAGEAYDSRQLADAGADLGTLSERADGPDDLPDLVVIDGGKGHLSAALKALRSTAAGTNSTDTAAAASAAVSDDWEDQLLRPGDRSDDSEDVSDVYADVESARAEGNFDLAFPGAPIVVSLAKRLEEVYMSGSGAPLAAATTGGADSPAMLVLRRARDEAHRFAVTFHRSRRAKAMFSPALVSAPRAPGRRRGGSGGDGSRGIRCDGNGGGHRRSNGIGGDGGLNGSCGRKGAPAISTPLEEWCPLAAVPGLPQKTREQLLDTFGGADGVASADEAELRRVPGIGPKLASRVLEALRRGLPPPQE